MGLSDHLSCLPRNVYVGQEATISTLHGTMNFQNWERSMTRLYYHPAYLTYMQSTSCKMLGWMKHKLESRLLGEITTTSDMQMIYHSNGRK